MKLNEAERTYLTALLREQNQNGCRGPAHDLLRKHVYSDSPPNGPGSLAFAYEAIPLTGLLLKELHGLQEIDDFCRNPDRPTSVEWPWSGPEEYLAKLTEARRTWMTAEKEVPASVE